MKKIILMMLLFFPLFSDACKPPRVEADHAPYDPCYIRHVCFTNDTETRNGPGKQLYVRAGDGYFNLAPGKTNCFDRRNKVALIKIYNCGITSCKTNVFSRKYKKLYATFRLNAKKHMYCNRCSSPYNTFGCRCNTSKAFFDNHVLYVHIE